MIKLILKTSLVFGLASCSSSGAFPPWRWTIQRGLRNYSATVQSTSKILNSLKPLKIYTSLNHPTKKIKMANDLTGQGGIILFYSKPTSLYAIEGSGNLAGYLQDLFNKEMLKLLADIKVPRAIQKKTKIQLKTHYQELLKSDWKDYDLYLLEVWKTSEEIDTNHRLTYYHAKYQPKLNLVRYVYSTNGEIEEVYQWNRFKTEEQLLTASHKKATLKPLLTYRIDKNAPLDKLKAKVWYENKNKAGVYRWINRINKQSYIGSTLNLGQVLYSLDKIDYLLKQAFQEHGLTSFNLQILAYCNIEEVAEKELYYFQLYQPEYNNKPEDNKEDGLIIDNSLSESPTSSSSPPLGWGIIEYNALPKQLVLFEPAIKQLTKISQPLVLSLTPPEVKLIIHESIKDPIIEVKAKKTWALSETTRQKQSLAQQKRAKHPRPGLAVQVQDLSNNSTMIYASIREAALALNIRDIRISEYFNRNQIKPYKKRYVFTKVCNTL